MEYLLLDTSMTAVSVIDNFNSIIWTERYYEAGDFVLHLPASTSLVEALCIDRYIWSGASKTLMIIEKQQLTEDTVDADYLTVTGRSLISILDRRIVWKQTILETNLEASVERLLNENAINPTDTKRKIPNLIFRKSGDSRITAIKIDTQFTGTNLYDAIYNLCVVSGVGISMFPEGSNIVFQLYMGQDRTYDQTTHPYVAFSHEFENLISSEYVDDIQYLKNVALIAGSDEGEVRKVTNIGDSSGLTRRELYVDARDISAEFEGTPIPDALYIELLKSRGAEKLEENTRDISVTGAVEDGRTFKFNKDYFIGDKVSLLSGYGIESVTRVIEMIYTQSVGDVSLIPTFILEEGSDE